jgi:hypothetical protein
VLTVFLFSQVFKKGYVVYADGEEGGEAQELFGTRREMLGIAG